MRKLLALLTLIPALAHSQAYNLFKPANGILVGQTTTYVTTAATSSNVISLWSGACSLSNFLRGDGSCALIDLTSNVTAILPVPNGGTGVATLTGLVLGNGASAMSAYGGTSCTNQFPRSLSASGVATCAKVSLTADITGVLAEANGGTNQSTYTLGDTLYASASNTLSKLAGNTTATKQFLTQTGTGAVSAAPAWGTIAAGDLPGSFSGFANPTASVALSAVNGSATTAMRSDAAPALSQSIVPTMSGLWTFTAGNPSILLQNDLAGIDIRNTAATRAGWIGTVKSWVGAGSTTDTAIASAGVTNFYENNSTTVSAQIASTGTTIGAPSGGAQGAGTISAQNGVFDNGTRLNTVLAATSASIGGGALLAGQCSSGTTTVTGATTSMVALADPNTYPGDGTYWDAQVTAANTVTTKVCAVIALTPTSATYNIRVIQ